MNLNELRQLQRRVKEIDGTPLDLRIAKILCANNGLKAALQSLEDVKIRRPKYAVIVSGSRDWTDTAAIKTALERVRQNKWPTFDVIVGDAKGADALARAIARDELGLTVRKFVTHYDRFGVSAGLKRNEEMLTVAIDEYNAVIVLAFQSPESHLHMIEIATMAKTNRYPVMLQVIEGGQP